MSGPGSQSSSKKQPKLTTFFGKRTVTTSEPATKTPAKRSASQSIDLTGDEALARRPAKRAQHVTTESPSSASQHEPPHAVVRRNAADQPADAQPAATRTRDASVSAAEKNARHVKAQRKLAQEAPRRGREPQKPQPMTPLEKQVSCCSCTNMRQASIPSADCHDVWCCIRIAPFAGRNAEAAAPGHHAAHRGGLQNAAFRR